FFQCCSKVVQTCDSHFYAFACKAVCYGFIDKPCYKCQDTASNYCSENDRDNAEQSLHTGEFVHVCERNQRNQTGCCPALYEVDYSHQSKHGNDEHPVFNSEIDSFGQVFHNAPPTC